MRQFTEMKYNKETDQRQTGDETLQQLQHMLSI